MSKWAIGVEVLANSSHGQLLPQVDCLVCMVTG